jgi:predicted thioesterase
MDFAELIPVGLKDEVIFPVDEAVTAKHIGSGSLRVLATPAMIGFMERASHAMIARCLPEGYSSVGVQVDVRHLAATPVGASVRIVTQVVEVDGRRVNLAVEAWDEQEKVGEGRHQRVVIDLARFLQRVEEKAKRLAGVGPAQA